MFKNTLKSLSKIALLSTLVGCTGWSEGLVGQLKIKDNLFFYVGKDAHKEYLKSGSTQISFNYGVYGISDPSVVIKQNEKEVKVYIPRELIKDETMEASSHELHQYFGVKAERVKTLLKKWEAEEFINCTDYGYCSKLVSNTDSNGKTTSGYEYGYHYDCPGKRKALVEHKKFSEKINIHFIDVFHKEQATFVNDNEFIFEKSKSLEYLSSCET
ncbi:MAG: hypothetical protein ACOYL6_13995 [Bacteriovoracaceae bacterium]